MDPIDMDTTAGGAQHWTVAEKGKRLALANKYNDALACYQDALQQAVVHQASPIILRHYTECILESLELMGRYQDVIAYCDEAIKHYSDNPPASDLAKRDFAAIYERKAFVSAKLADWIMAENAAQQARKIAGDIDAAMPLLDKMIRWLDNRLYLTIDRIEKEQRQAGYFSVRQDTLTR
jgi:tetratricopeptide (TPR) repeat protein